VFPHWSTIICPLLRALDAGPIVEIGAYEGETTFLLAQLAAERGITLHVIDPDPAFDIADLQDRFGDCFRFHQAKSHDALEQIGPVAAALIDGDHNWYSVHGELERLERTASSDGVSFPLVMFHDVEWPYARRDMYWNPDAIPEEWRKPWSRSGIRWGQRGLDDSGFGLNHGMPHASEEGGPRNGVLTAVEDFVEDASGAVELRVVYGGHGLGVLAPRKLLESNSEVRRQWNYLWSSEFLKEQTRQLSAVAAMESAARKRVVAEYEHLRRELEDARSGHQAKVISSENGQTSP
jgi:Methyltransferase domain